MDASPKKCLMRWREYSDSVTVAVQALRHHEELLDVTLACEGKTIRAHKLVLAACSQYFRQVFKEFPCEHPTIILDGIRWDDLLCILQFMYCGLVLVEEDAVCSLLAAAYTLDIVGLNYVTEALLENKVIYTSNERKGSDEEDCSKTKHTDSIAESKPDDIKQDIPDVCNLSSEAQNQTLKDNSTRNSSPSRSNLSNEANMSSISDSERSCSVGSPHLNFRSYNLDSGIQPPLKRIKNGCENNPPDMDEISSPNLEEERVNGSMFYELHKSFEKFESRRLQSREKVLSERKFSEENQHRDSVSPCNMRIQGYPVVNGDSIPPTLSKSFDDSESLTYDDPNSLDNESSQDGYSQDNADSDMGPAPLPYNHPAVLASSKSNISQYSAAAAAAIAAAAANGGSISPINYAAYLAANSRAVMSNSSMDSVSPHNNSPSPSGMCLPVWMPPTNNTSPSPSPPPPGSGNFPPGYIHPSGMSQQDLQATLEQYQRKLAFHEPRPCPTCRRMYRDAATLRTHIAIMHSEGKEPFACTCGSLFRTKYDMYQHKKNGHR